MTTAGAPLVAGPGAWAGVAIVEDVRELDAAVRDRSWVDATLAGVGTALDGLALAVDPAGSLVQYGVAWLIEQVKPLAEALDWLAGDASRITAHAQTWARVAAALTAEADGLAGAVRSETSGWTGAAAGAYQTWIGDQEKRLRALGAASGVMAEMAGAAGGLAGSVRLLVRDAIAAVVARLVLYAAELVASGGIALPLVVGQVTALCASWAGRISRWLKALLDSLRRLVSQSDKLTGLVKSIGAKTGGAKTGGDKTGGDKTGGDKTGGDKTGGDKTGADKTGAGKDVEGEKAAGNDGRGHPGDGRPGEEDAGTGTLVAGSDFDAGKDRAPLGAGFRSGVADPEALFADKERAIAEVLAGEGAMVHPRRRIDDVTGLKNPDAMVRTGPDDPGVVTEFKTPESASSSSIRSNIVIAGEQVRQYGGGDVVIDGRAAGLTEETARQGFARAVGHARVHGSLLPDRVRMILADGTIIELAQRGG